MAEPEALSAFLNDAEVEEAVFSLRPDYRALLLAVDGIDADPGHEAVSEVLLQRAEARHAQEHRRLPEMMTVHEVAEHYGVGAAFMVRALDRIGFKNAEPDTSLPTPTVTRFEAASGDKIRAAQPRPPHLVSAESDTKPAAARWSVSPSRTSCGSPTRRSPPDATRRGTGQRGWLESSGLVHAIDAAGTNDGDPWDGEVVPGAA